MKIDCRRVSVRACMAVALVVVSGCSVSRHQEVKRLSKRVESNLRDEQSIALKNSAVSPFERQQRLEHLTGLRYTLSGANVALGSVPRVVPEEHRPVAYDVLEEVYATIDWNIPLGAGDALRPLPAGFAPAGGLDLSALTGGARSTAGSAATPGGVLISPIVPSEE